MSYTHLSEQFSGSRPAYETIVRVILGDSLNAAKNFLKRVTGYWIPMYLELEVVFIGDSKHLKFDFSSTRQPKKIENHKQVSESTDLIFGVFIKIFFS
jgi:hypothetical protein